MQPIAAFLFIALPWLNPFAAGPQPAVAQHLFTWACVAGLLAVWGRPARRTSADHGAPPVAPAWLAAALVSAVLGLLQYFGLTAGLDPWVNSTSVGEAFANLRQRNQFATLTSMGLMALLWQVAQPDSVAPRRQWPLWLAGAALLAMGNAVSGSRTGLLQWCLVLALLAMWRKQLRWRALTVGVGAVAFYFLAIRAMPWLLEETTGVHAAGLLGRFNDETGCNSRRVLWANVLHLIAQKPWLGWGWGELDYAHFITLYPGERFCDILDNAHNLPLHLAVELGLPFASVTCAAGLWLVLRATPWREADPTRQMAWAVLAVMGLHSLLEYPLWYGPFQMAAGLCVWLLLRNPVAARVLPQSFEAFRPTAPVWPALAASFLIAFCAYAGWDYWRVSQLYLLPAQRFSLYRDDTLDKLRGSWLFRNQVQFAELTTTPTTAGHAAQLREQALQLLHFSPEPRVVEKLIESTVLVGHDDEAAYFLERYRAAFPDAHARFLALRIPDYNRP